MIPSATWLYYFDSSTYLSNILNYIPDYMGWIKMYIEVHLLQESIFAELDQLPQPCRMAKGRDTHIPRMDFICYS